jgi:hypothetical protein
MKEFIDLIKDLNVPTILGIIAAVWWANRGLRADMKELKGEVSDIRKDISSIHKEFKFINIRVSRLEGSFYGKEIYRDSDI